MAVGESGTILTSVDRREWSRRNSGTEAMLMGVGFGNGVWVAVGDDGSILTSGRDQSPSLFITLVEQKVVIVWPADAIGFVLETTSNLEMAPQAWNLVNKAPVLSNSQHIVTEPISNSVRFYRLRKR